MSENTFYYTRSILTAILLSGLLILAHVLLTTTANVPVAIHLTPGLGKAMTAISSLIFFTLLWTAFTLHERADVDTSRTTPASEPRLGATGGDQEQVFHGRTWVQLLGGDVLLIAWGVFWDKVALVMKAYSPSLNPAFTLISILFPLVVMTLFATQAHLMGSIAYHAATGHFGDLMDGDFWEGRVGWWTERIALVDESDDEKV